MARMVPFPMLPTESSAERRPYEGFLEQLDDSEAVCPPLPANLRNARPIHEFVSVYFDAEHRPHAAGPPGRPVEVLD